MRTTATASVGPSAPKIAGIAGVGHSIGMVPFQEPPRTALDQDPSLSAICCLDVLSKNIGELDVAVTTLCDRLTAILPPPSPEKPHDPKGCYSPGNSSEIVDRILGQARRVMELTECVRRIASCVQV